MASQNLFDSFPVFGELPTLEIVRPQGESSNSDIGRPCMEGSDVHLKKWVKYGIHF